MSEMKMTTRQWIALGVLTLGAFVAVLNQTLLTPAFPAIMAEYGVDTATVQWLTTGFTLVNAIMIPITAYLTDRFPVRTLFAVAMGIFTLGTFFDAIAPTFGALLTGRLIQAAGAGIMMPMILNVFMLTFPIEKRGQAMGFYGLIIAVAPSIGPTLAGVVIDHASWHDLFFGMTILCLIVLVLGVIFAGKTPANNAGVTLDKLSVVQSSVGFGSLLYGFSSMTNASPLICVIWMIVGVIFVVAFFRRQNRLEHPMLQVDILKTRRFALSNIIGMVVQASLLSFGIILPIYMQSMRGYSATVSGLVLLPATLVMGAMGPIAGRLFDRHGARKLALVGTVILAITTLMFATLSDSTSAVTVATIYAVRLFGLSLVNMPISTWGMNALDNKVINHGNALMNTFRQVAGSFGGALLVVVMDAGASMSSSYLDPLHSQIFGVDLAFGLSGLLCVVACVLTFIYVRDEAPSKDVRVSASTKSSGNVVANIMKRDVYTVHENDRILDVLRLFSEKHISAVPVVDDQNKMVGFISDGDVMRFLSTRAEIMVDPVMMIAQVARDDEKFDDRLDKLMNKSVKEVEHHGAIAVREDASMGDVCRVMGQNHLKKVPVVGPNNTLVGVINRSNITNYAITRYLERTNQMATA